MFFVIVVGLDASRFLSRDNAMETPETQVGQWTCIKISLSIYIAGRR